MAKHGWMIWIVPLAVWGLYGCWHCGYQSGYAEGHETAWKMYQPFVPQSQIATMTDIEDPSESETTR